MREEILRILRLVEQGRLRPEEALSLLEALGYPEAAPEAPPQEERAQEAEAQPPPRAETRREGVEELIERIGRIASEAVKSVEWHKIGETIRSQTQRVQEEVQKMVEHLERGGWRVGVIWGHKASAEHTLNFEIAPGQKLTIQVPIGDVKVRGGAERGRVYAQVTLHGASQEEAQQRAQGWSLILESTETGVTIRAPELHPPHAADVDLEVEIPTGVALEINTIRGDVTVRNTAAPVTFSNTQGDLIVEEARGALRVETAGGDIAVKRFQGERLELDTKNGDICLEEAQAEELIVRAARGDLSLKKVAAQHVTCETVRGDIDLELTVPVCDQVQLTTVSGDIALEVPDGSNCRVSLNTVVGEVSCGLPAHEVEAQPNRWSGVCGEGAGRLQVSTVHGDISVKIGAST